MISEVMSADGWIVDTNIVIREAPDRIALFVHVVFCEDLSVQAQHQTCHLNSIRAGLTEPSQDFVKYTSACGKRLNYVSHDHRNVIPTTVIVR